MEKLSDLKIFLEKILEVFHKRTLQTIPLNTPMNPVHLCKRPYTTSVYETPLPPFVTKYSYKLLSIIVPVPTPSLPLKV